MSGAARRKTRLRPPLTAAGDSRSQIWHLDAQDEDTYTLTNKSSGKALDVYEQSTQPGGRIVQWDAHGGANQQWKFQKP